MTLSASKIRKEPAVRWTMAGLLNGAFVAIWAALQWLLQWLLDLLPLVDPVDTLVLTVFKVLFAVATLVPVAVFVIIDSYVMIIRSMHVAKRERRKIAGGDASGNSI